ncbi:SufS family cysteine desulfurase [Singulisphaera acidiphila]|uniref:cysteine desulfurase n=1 Tax=Singulisphaera acidiphila (strain ATCC BAA-1392 / DSM 18658 / VKM B-2454 / MOB10) TaxID=886293 RepID=L0D8B1_SINAD|nr:SufS family cysteine desulfurase [Singulisphaera acidiphila]AGA25649.1 cysteine desulfurase-like protein, SufS subfamily [Singulisphaera acidiphila DSM 18658]
MSLAPTRPNPRNASRTDARGATNLARVRSLFPALGQEIHGKPLIYLDNAASTQKPRPVIDAIVQYYEADNANVHRGAHALSDRATAAYERARETTRRFLNARRAEEIIFVRGTTEAANLLAQTFGRQNVGQGDEVLITELEHHANFVPWQQLCLEKGARLRALPINERGELQLEALDAMLTPRTKLVAVAHVSNALGTVNPVKAVVEAAHRRGIPVFIDGAQGLPHAGVDVQELGCDFYAFSGHKIYGPMGVGVLYGRLGLLESMPPWQFGGDMVHTVGFDRTTFGDPPYRFEAGTPNVAGAVGLAAALEFLESVGRDRIADHEAQLLGLAVQRLNEIPGVRIVGEPAQRAGVVSFVVDQPPMSALDVGTRLDAEGIAVRAGNHCCQPLMGRLGVAGTVRASFALYNTTDEVEQFAAALRSVVGVPPATRSDSGRSPGQDDTEPEAIYPGPTARTIEQTAEAMLDELDSLDGWGERYEFLIELGRRTAPLPETLRTEDNRVRGCQSTVYVAARARPGTKDVIEFLVDSNSEVVRGLLAVLQELFSGHRAGEVLAFDLASFLARGGLESNLTTGRRNGLAETIKRLRAIAAAIETDGVAE